MLKVFCDFDGTITNRDSIVLLTERFGDGPSFRSNILKEIQSGRITVFEAIERELKTVRVDWETARSFLEAEIVVDPTFVDFVKWCRQHKIPLQVVSSGLRPVVDHFLRGLDLTSFAHPVVIKPTGWEYLHDKQVGKERLLRACRRNSAPQTKIVYIGDGTSDVCVLPWIDLLFATGYLAQYCQDRQIEFVFFESFEQIRQELSALSTGLDQAC